MPIYTKKGDRGKTSLYGGKMVLKSSVIIDTYGNIDEFSSLIGLVISKNKHKKKLLTTIQKDLYEIMAYLSGAKTNLEFIDKRVGFFEEEIDKISKNLLTLNRFVLPQGTEISCWFHVLRTVCRRCERLLVGCFGKILNNDGVKIKIIKYFNRLSDLFFILARDYNNRKEVVIIKQ